MSLRTPLARARGLGSAKDGAGHWWAQRLTAVVLVPLAAWFVISLIAVDSLDYPDVTAWMAGPINSILLTTFLVVLVYHSKLGVQVVIEDYVHGHALKITSLIVSGFAHLLIGVAGVVSIMRVAFAV